MREIKYKSIGFKEMKELPLCFANLRLNSMNECRKTNRQRLVNGEKA